MATAKPSETDVAWLAGLFEGEGCITLERNGGIRITIGMTDLDVIERVQRIFPARSITSVQPKPVKDFFNQPKVRYNWRIGGVPARDILVLLLPYFGERRAARAREAIAVVESRPGTNGWHNRNKTHCAQGHEYTPENTYIRPNSANRHCRACRNEWARQYRDRRSQGLERR